MFLRDTNTVTNNKYSPNFQKRRRKYVGVHNNILNLLLSLFEQEFNNSIFVSNIILAINSLHYFILYSAWSRVSLEGKMSTLWAARPRNCGSNAVRGLSRPFLWSIQLPISLTVNRPWHKANHSYQSTAEIMNGWSYTSIPPTPTRTATTLHSLYIVFKTRTYSSCRYIEANIFTLFLGF